MTDTKISRTSTKISIIFYSINIWYSYSGTPEDYVNDCFELQTKGILVLI